MDSKKKLSLDNPALQRCLEIIKESVQGEKNDELFYNYLISTAPTDEEKMIITSIRNDEIKHNKMFRSIYKYFTNKDITASEDETFQRPASYIDGIRVALFGELSAVERYRDIKKCLPLGTFRDMLFEIITDEIKHAIKYNYIFTLNKECVCKPTAVYPAAETQTKTQTKTTPIETAPVTEAPTQEAQNDTMGKAGKIMAPIDMGVSPETTEVQPVDLKDAKG
ncbi:ferritin-like domain-containing protein [Clostridium pascui]|uniref:ferritin-like domain-containing protein n=1 Tax=Clostridium pascui TaxID=46609 RepID=UPI001FAFA402|nr:ferritin-like domain-containing protein [Clostridium pascui]